jgi:hypothetical protein
MKEAVVAFSRRHSNIRLEGLRNAMKNLSQDIRCVLAEIREGNLPNTSEKRYRPVTERKERPRVFIDAMGRQIEGIDLYITFSPVKQVTNTGQ